MSRCFAEAGWEKIAKIEPEIWTDENGLVEYEIVWLISKRGDVFIRDLRKGETIKSVSEHYTKRGYTDDNAIFYRSLRDC